MSSIDLGRKMPGYAMASPAPPKEDERIYYPSTCLDTNKDLELPEEGEITFRFKLNRDSTNHNRREPDGQKKFSYDLELLSVESVTDSAPSKKKIDGSVALDKLKEEAEADDKGDEYDDE